MTLLSIKRKLESRGYSVELINNYINSNNEKIPALIVDTDFSGLYPTAEVMATHSEVKKLVKNSFTAKSHPSYVAIYIF